MPLHDWSALSWWPGVHHLWLAELLYWIQPRLPAGYRAYIGSTPTFAIDASTDERPDVGVRSWPDLPEVEATVESDPDEVEIAVATLAPDRTLYVERQGLLVAAIELVSPRNKDRNSARDGYTSIYAGYLIKGVHLLLIDVHRLPARFSFADRIAAELGFVRPPCPVPFAMTYRVGEESPNGGRFLALTHRPMEIGQPLPTVRLPLSVQQAVSIDLEATYARPTAAAYLA